MSFAGNPAGGNNQNQPTSKANFDTTSGGGNNRDPWNNKVPQQQTKTITDQNADPNADPNNQNDDGIDDELIAKIWDKVENTTGNQTTQTTQQTQQTTQQTQVDPQKQMTDYLAKVGLTPVTIDDADKEKIQAGDFTPLLDKLNAQIVQAHVKALSGAKELSDRAIADASKNVKDQAIAHMLGQQNLAAMHQALPFTKDKAIAPVAQSVMQKFLDRGFNTEKAVKGVEAYFQNISSRVNGGNTSRNQNYSSGVNSEQQKENNWLDVLSPRQG